MKQYSNKRPSVEMKEKPTSFNLEFVSLEAFKGDIYLLFELETPFASRVFGTEHTTTNCHQ